MIVDRRALAGAPGHRDDAVAEIFAAIELAARVVIGRALEHALGQAHVAVAHQIAQRFAQRFGDRDLLALADGGVQRVDETAATGKIERQHGFGLAQRGMASPGHGQTPRLITAGHVHITAGKGDFTGLPASRAMGSPKRGMSTRNESWPCGLSSATKSTVGAARAQAVGDLLLLGQREQDVGRDADDERALDADAAPARRRRRRRSPAARIRRCRTSRSRAKGRDSCSDRSCARSAAHGRRGTTRSGTRRRRAPPRAASESRRMRAKRPTHSIAERYVMTPSLRAIDMPASG